MSMNINTNMMTAYFPKAGYKMGIEKKKLSGTKDTEHTFAEAQKTQNGMAVLFFIFPMSRTGRQSARCAARIIR